MPRGLRYVFALGVSLPHGFLAFGAMAQPDAGVASSAEVAMLSTQLELAQKRTEVLQMTIESTLQAQSLGLTTIGILLALVGLLFPLLAYLTSILPAQQIVKEARLTLNNLDERFLELTADYQAREVATAMELLRSEDPVERRFGAQYLSQHPRTPLTEVQVSEICRAAERADQATQTQIFHAMADRDSPTVAKALAASLETPAAINVLSSIVKHCALPSGKSLQSPLEDWLVRPENQRMLTTVLVTAMMSAPSVAESLLNKASFLERIDPYYRVSGLAGLRGIAGQFGFAAILETSELARGVMGTVTSFQDKDMNPCKPAEAQYAMRWEDGTLKATYPKGTGAFAAAVKEGDEPS